MHYKHQFLKLTIEFYYRFVVPSPFSIVVQIFALIKKDFRKNPFGTNYLITNIRWCWSLMSPTTVYRELAYCAQSPLPSAPRFFAPSTLSFCAPQCKILATPLTNTTVRLKFVTCSVPVSYLHHHFCVTSRALLTTTNFQSARSCAYFSCSTCKSDTGAG